MLRMLNAGGIPGAQLNRHLYGRIADDWGFHGIRQGIPVGLGVEGIVELCQVISGKPAVVILAGWQAAGHGWDEVYRHAPLSGDEVYQEAHRLAWAMKRADLDGSRWLIEPGNEPDLTDPISQRPELCRERVLAALQGLRDEGAGNKLITPGVSNLNKGGGHDYLIELLAGLPEEIAGGIHPYRTHVRPEEKFDGWDKINDAVWELRQAQPRRSWGVTEIGWHNGPQFKGWGPWKKEWRFSAEDVAAFFTWEHDFWARERAIVFVWYQLNDGPEDTAMDRYGLRTIDDKDKPAADAARKLKEVTA